MSLAGCWCRCLTIRLRFSSFNVSSKESARNDSRAQLLRDTQVVLIEEIDGQKCIKMSITDEIELPVAVTKPGRISSHSKPRTQEV